jgi:transposase-like protein
MHTHPNARLTPIGRERLIRQHLDEGTGLAQLAAGHGISERTARKWLARFRSGGPAALADRWSVRRTQRRTLDPQQLQQAVELRHQRCTLRKIARLLLVPITTLARAMRRLGLNRLRKLDPKPPVQRYQWEKPGDMIHVDIKQLARFERVGHRITGDPRKGSSPGAGYEKVHVAVDDATRRS